MTARGFPLRSPPSSFWFIPLKYHARRPCVNGDPAVFGAQGLRLPKNRARVYYFESMRRSGTRPAALKPVIFLAALSLIAGISLAGCDRTVGWGLVLWSVPTANLKAGSVVPIYLKSNIGKVYVIGVEGAAPVGKPFLAVQGPGKIELPFWQVQEYRSRRAAREGAARLADYAGIYLIATRDGLPIRESPANSARRVFRLREGQMVKVLEKAKGEQVTTGGKALPGDWYRVLADDGTRGYVFSNTMKFHDEATGQAPVLESEKTLSASIDLVFSRTWRPAWYQTMIDEDRIDTDWFSLRFGLFADAVNRQIRIEMPGFSRVYEYSSITEEEGAYLFAGTPLIIRVQGDRALEATWSGAARLDPAAGGGQDPGWRRDDPGARFVTMDADIPELVRRQESRAADARAAFFANAVKLGFARPGARIAFAAPDGGTLVLSPSGDFGWTQTDLLPAGFAPAVGEDAAITGTLRFGLVLDQSLAGSWQGGFVLVPGTAAGSNGTSGASAEERHRYAYRLGADGLSIARIVEGPAGSRADTLDQRRGVHTLAPAPVPASR